MSLLSKIDITINQKPLKSFQKVSVKQTMYGLDSFEIICRYDAYEDLDGFLIEQSKDFLGLPIVIQTKILADDDDEKDGINFRGFVTEIQSSRSKLADYDQIIISGGSSEIAMNGKPVNRAFFDNNLEEIVKEVLKKYDFKSDVAPRNKERYPYIVQFEENDLEFIRRLSIRYGEWCYFDGQSLNFGEIPSDSDSQKLIIGSNLDNFRYGLKANPVKFHIFTVDPLEIKVHRYNSGNAKIEGNLNIYGKHALKMSENLFSEEGRDYYEHVNTDETEYQKGIDIVGETVEAADAVNLTFLSGESGNGFLKTGTFAEIKCIKHDGQGNTDYGKYLITSVHHEMDNILTYRNSFTAVPAESSIPENTNPYFVRKSSNQLAIVKDNKDPEKLGRVKISFHWMEGRQSTPWIKIITPYSHKNAGFYFVPPVHSRVIAGFEDGDVEKPYILGNLFDKDTHPDPGWADNRIANSGHNAKVHAIRTLTGNTIEIDDSDNDEKIRIYDTDGNNQIELNTANKKIIISTKGSMEINAGGSLKINAGNIKISADGDISINAGDNLKQNATNISTEASANLKQKGTMIEAAADSSFKASGNGNAEISSSGQTTVKGSLVMIN